MAPASKAGLLPPTMTKVPTHHGRGRKPLGVLAPYYGRGAASIKWAYKRNEAVTAATWFWADEGLDTGNICEQEIVKIDHSIKPRQFYERDIIPALCRTLERCLSSLKIGLKREVKQQGKYATFDRKEGL